MSVVLLCYLIMCLLLKVWKGSCSRFSCVVVFMVVILCMMLVVYI